MYKKTAVAAALFFLLIAAGFRYAKEKPGNSYPDLSKENILKSRQIIQCSPDWNYINEDSLGKAIGVLPGWGSYRWNIASASDSARFYFNQGINMYYAFHIIEAMASFKKAALFDGNNAMICWAQALAYGPNINDFAYVATPEAFAAAQKAVKLQPGCTEKEKALIGAMALRYSADSTVSRESLNQLYTSAMKKTYTRFKQDADIAALYADALMLQHPWDYWKHTGEAEPWTPEITAVLEGILKTAPLHPGANHYYIHAVEASPAPARALASADRLGKLMPGVAHMVHMPSHIYIRSGNYRQGIIVNEMSVKGYNNYLGLYPEVQNNAPLYLFHNLHMQSACAMMRAGYQYSYTTAKECSNSLDTAFLSLPQPMGNFVQYVYMTGFINNVRFGKWDSILNAAPVAEQHIYASVLWHWARGMAFAGKNELVNAATELKAMQDKVKLPDMFIVMQPFNSPDAAAKVAEKILAGTIATKQSDYTHAVSLLKEAVANEDNMIYNEPKDWLLPARQYLGNTLLLCGQAGAAEKVFSKDLQENPGNHWALYGLYEALLRQKKAAAAAAVKKQYEKAVAGSDIGTGHIVF
jgi:tetratricopeptide (TPR) repeat protein